MRIWPIFAVTLLFPGALRAERVPIPPAAESKLAAGDHSGAAVLIEPVFTQCMSVPDPRDTCMDIVIFMLRVADAAGDAKAYDALLAAALRYAELVLPPMDREFADLRARFGDRLFEASDYAGAEAQYRQVLSARKAATPIDDAALELALSDLEITLSVLDKFEEALPVASERVTVAERIGDPLRLAQALSRAGRVALERGRYADAEGWLRKSATLDEQAGTPRRAARIIALDALSLVLFEQRRLPEARAIAVQALALATEVEGESGKTTLDLQGDIAIMDRDLGNLDAAEARLRRAIGVAEATSGTSMKVSVRLVSILGTILVRTGRRLDALRLLAPPIDRLMAASTEDQSDLSDLLQNYAVALAEVGRLAEAEPISRRVLTIRKQTLRADDPLIARALDSLGYIVGKLDRPAEALDLHIQAVELLLGNSKDDAALSRNDLLITALGNLATTLVALGRAAEAQPFQTQALELSRKLFPAGSQDLATALNRWAQYRKAMRQCDGLDAAREARAIWARAAGPVSQDRVVGDINLASYLRMCGGNAAQQRGYWRDAARYLLADAGQSTDYDARATQLLRDRRIVFYGMVDANWQLANTAK